jgi:hypothetical protein
MKGTSRWPGFVVVFLAAAIGAGVVGFDLPNGSIGSQHAAVWCAVRTLRMISCASFSIRKR